MNNKYILPDIITLLSFSSKKKEEENMLTFQQGMNQITKNRNESNQIYIFFSF